MYTYNSQTNKNYTTLTKLYFFYFSKITFLKLLIAFFFFLKHVIY